MKIYKFPLELTSMQVLKLPVGSQILTVQNQYDKPVLWVLGNFTGLIGKEEHFIYIYGTGHELGDCDNKKYVGTFQSDGGSLVFHVFSELLEVF